MNRQIRKQIKSTSLWITFFLLSFTLITPLAAKADVALPPHVSGQIIIGLDPVQATTIDDIHATYDTTTIAQITPTIFLIQPPADQPLETLLDLLGLDPRLEFAELNLIGDSPEHSGQDAWAWGGQDAAPYAQQYALDMLDIPTAHTISQGAGITVAILDTGVQLDHPALTTAVTPTGFDFIDMDAIPADDTNGLDDDQDGLVDEAAGHGTHVAGIVRLVAPQSAIMPVRVLNSDGRGSVYTVAEGILYAAAQGADVINLSLGLPQKSELLKLVIRQATRQGTLVIAAAGNAGTTTKQYPAASKCALAVTAVSPTGTPSDFAGTGNWVAFAAPGDSIYSTFIDSSYAWWTGTSMAAPFVTGQAALLRSLDPTLTLRDYALLIAHPATPLTIANHNHPEEDQDFGLVDISASLQL
ncbi:MAG: S8 family serine peptidase, partial [Anaerolineae bacterium]